MSMYEDEMFTESVVFPYTISACARPEGFKEVLLLSSTINCFNRNNSTEVVNPAVRKTMDIMKIKPCTHIMVEYDWCSWLYSCYGKRNY